MRLSHQSQQPAQKKAVSPIGNCNLITCDEAKRGPSAMDRRPIRQIFAQIMSELFLWATADRNHEVSRSVFLNPRQKVLIVNFQPVPGGDITVLNLDRKSFSAETIEQFLPCARSG